MILINEKLLETLDFVKNPKQNQYPFLAKILNNFDSLDEQRKNQIYEEVWLELYRGSWNSINKSFPIKSFSFDQKAGYYTSVAVLTTELKKNILLERNFFIKVDSHELLFNFICYNITAQKHYRGSISFTPVTLTSLEKEAGIESIKKALKKAEIKFSVDFPDTDSDLNTIVQYSKKGVKTQEDLIKEKVQNAFWDVLYSEGISKFNYIEINHIKKVYDKTLHCFIDFANCPKHTQFEIFEKAIERARFSKTSEAQTLYYEIVKNNLDTRVRIKKEQIWNKVAEKRARNVPDQFVLAKSSSKTNTGNILNIVFVTYEKYGSYESFHVSDLWNLLNVE